MQQHQPADAQLQRVRVAAGQRVGDPAERGGGTGDPGVAGLRVLPEQGAAGERHRELPGVEGVQEVAGGRSGS